MRLCKRHQIQQGSVKTIRVLTISDVILEQIEIAISPPTQRPRTLFFANIFHHTKNQMRGLCVGADIIRPTGPFLLRNHVATLNKFAAFNGNYIQGAL